MRGAVRASVLDADKLMSAAFVTRSILIAAGAVLLAFTLTLQTRRISRVWLRWIPRTVREPLSAYFDPPPSVHPNLPDPNEIEIEDAQSAGRKSPPAACAFS